MILKKHCNFEGYWRDLFTQIVGNYYFNWQQVCFNTYSLLPLASEVYLRIVYKILKHINIYYYSDESLILQWVPSHIGRRRNEQAGKLAKLAITDGIECNIKLSYSDSVFDFKNLWYDKFKYFHEGSKGILFKAIQNPPSRTP